MEEHRQIGADHKLGAVGEIQKIHDAEYERQTGSNEKQQHPELETIQGLHCEEGVTHRAGAVISSRIATHRHRHGHRELFQRPPSCRRRPPASPPSPDNNPESGSGSR